MSIIALTKSQILAFNGAIDTAVITNKIKGKTAHFAKQHIERYGQNFDIQKFKSWARQEVSKYDTTLGASTTLIDIVDNTLKPTFLESCFNAVSRFFGMSTTAINTDGKTQTLISEKINKIINATNSQIEDFDSELKKALQNGSITHATYKNTLATVKKYSKHLDVDEFHKFASRQVKRFDPEGVTHVLRAFTKVFLTGLLPIPSGVNHSVYQGFTPSDNLRLRIRDETIDVVDSSRLRPSDFQESMYLDVLKKPLKDAQKSCALLPRFGALTVTGLPKINYTSNWTNKYGYNQFDTSLPTKSLSVTYVASPNIGESFQAGDASDYRNIDGTLNEVKFLQDFKNVCEIGLRSQKSHGANHFVWNPIGMGAFLRNVHKNFKGISRDYVSQLRDKLAEQVINAFSEIRTSNDTLHLCLFTGTTESDENYNAFIKALDSTSAVRGGVHVHQNGDMLEIGQHLANKYGDGKASVIIAANRKLLGNIWRSDRARFASDENIHRRWHRLAQVANYLNGGLHPTTRSEGELQARISEVSQRSVS